MVGGHRPELAGHVAAIGFDTDSGRLTVCPESSAWATKTRLEQTRIVATANESAGRTVVRTLRILPPGTAPAPEPADVDPEPAAAPAGPPRTRETAWHGYRRALAAHQEAAPPAQVDPHIAEACCLTLRQGLREQRSSRGGSTPRAAPHRSPREEKCSDHVFVVKESQGERSLHGMALESLDGTRALSDAPAEERADR
ncbi:DUF721 domain-containing protein [Streptomyces lunalinharesii]|uniref:Uncharacterized protein n=1 Tax=Streptomyces lunalinharesii TaxID=333384 RepID=A0ABN3T4F0_9ACTN